MQRERTGTSGKRRSVRVMEAASIRLDVQDDVGTGQLELRITDDVADGVVHSYAHIRKEHALELAARLIAYAATGRLDLD